MLAMTILILFWLLTRSSVPSYQGIDLYTLMFNQSSSALDSSPGFMAIGSNAVPFLARALATDKTLYDKFSWLRRPSFQKFAQSNHLGFTWWKSAREVRHAAAFSLLAFIFEARPALPQLHIELLRAIDTERQTIVNCLSELGPPPESIPWLVKAFPFTTNETYVVRHDLLLTLGRAGSNTAQLAMPIALASLSDEVWDVRSVAAQAIANWGRPEPAAIPLLLSLLTSTNEYAAMSAAMALGRITNRCNEAISSLRKMLASTNDYYRAVASMTLWRLGGEAEETRQTLENLLTSKGGKGVAAEYLGQMGPAARASLPTLLKACQQSIAGAWVDMHDRAECAKAILHIQGESTDAYAVLEESITTEKNSWVRQTVTAEIAELGPLAQPLIPVLRRVLNDPKREVRHEAMLALELLEKRNKKN